MHYLEINQMPHFRRFTSALLLAILFVAGCKHQPSNELRVGVTPGPAEEILHAIEPGLAERGVVLKIVPFTDYVQPNLALASHDLDANLYQNVPFLDQFNHDHSTGLVTLTKAYLPLMAIYAGKTTSFATLHDGSRISLPNDPVNQARALHLLQTAGLLTLNATAGNKTALTDIKENPHHLQLVELDASQLPRSRDDVDLAVINANFALDAGLNPIKDSLFHETADSEYANVLVTDSTHASDPKLQKLSQALRSPTAQTYITTHYQGAVLPAS
jgi:D-methionine transport system substrate-binding protein